MNTTNEWLTVHEAEMQTPNDPPQRAAGLVRVNHEACSGSGWLFSVAFREWVTCPGCAGRGFVNK